jgi:hypothetical protein
VLRNDKETGQLVGVLPQNSNQPVALSCEVAGADAKQDHTGVGKPLPNDQVTEVCIVRDQHTPFAMGDREDVLIGEMPTVVSHDRGNVMTYAGEIIGKSKTHVRVEQQLHAVGRAA